MRGSLATLERLTQIFPEDVSLKNDLGVAHLLLGDNKGAKRVYEEVCACVYADSSIKHTLVLMFSDGSLSCSPPPRL